MNYVSVKRSGHLYVRRENNCFYLRSVDTDFLIDWRHIPSLISFKYNKISVCIYVDKS